MMKNSPHEIKLGQPMENEKFIKKNLQPTCLITNFILSASLLLLAGCQKNSYESCVEYQTAAATRARNQYPQLYKDLQATIDSHVAVNCKGVS